MACFLDFPTVRPPLAKSAPGAFFAFHRCFAEMQKMNQVQILQQVITVEVAVAHTAVYVGDPRSLGRTDGGWE